MIYASADLWNGRSCLNLPTAEKRTLKPMTFRLVYHLCTSVVPEWIPQYGLRGVGVYMTCRRSTRLFFLVFLLGSLKYIVIIYSVVESQFTAHGALDSCSWWEMFFSYCLRVGHKTNIYSVHMQSSQLRPPAMTMIFILFSFALNAPAFQHAKSVQGKDNLIW